MIGDAAMAVVGDPRLNVVNTQPDVEVVLSRVFTDGDRQRFSPALNPANQIRRANLARKTFECPKSIAPRFVAQERIHEVAYTMLDAVDRAVVEECLSDSGIRGTAVDFLNAQNDAVSGKLFIGIANAADVR